MFGVTDDQRAEAVRLLSLDEEGQRVEILAHALAEVEAARESAAELKRLDREMLDEFLERKTGNLAGEAEGSAG
jgi:hypothetical protein